MNDKVLVVGSLNYDMILKQKRLPEAGETYAVDNATFCGGGKGANQAVQCAKLGANVYMAGAVGNDAMGSVLRNTIVGYGVDDRYLKTVQGSSGVGIVNCLDDGTVFANIIRGANFAITKEDIDELDEVLSEVNSVILQLEIPIPIVEYVIEKAHAKGVKVLLNTAPAADISESSLKKCDFIIANEVEASYYCGKNITDTTVAKEEIIKFCRKLGTNSIFTLGKAGAVVCDGEHVEFIPSKEVHAVETTGAGDSFVGALAFCQTREMDLFTSARFATHCSALTVCKEGAQPAMPTLDEVRSNATGNYMI